MIRQLKQTCEITGALKSVNLEKKVSKNKNNFIKGSVIIEQKEEVNGEVKVHNHKFEVFVMESSKLYKGFNTVMSEYKSKDASPEDFDTVKATFTVSENKYSTETEFVRKQQFDLLFLTREEKNTPHSFYMNVGCVVTNYTQETKKDANGIELPTGFHKVEGFTIGYNNKIIDLHDLKIKDSLVNAFKNLYFPGSAGMLKLKPVNSCTITEIQKEQSYGFGEPDTRPEVIKDYERRLEITGGDIPFTGEEMITQQEIAQCAQLRIEQDEEIKKQNAEYKAQKAAEQTQTAPTGFGDNGGFDEAIDENDMPF